MNDEPKGTLRAVGDKRVLLDFEPPEDFPADLLFTLLAAGNVEQAGALLSMLGAPPDGLLDDE